MLQEQSCCHRANYPEDDDNCDDNDNDDDDDDDDLYIIGAVRLSVGHKSHDFCHGGW